MTHLIFLTQDSPMRRSLFAAMLLASLCLPTVGVAQGGADLLRRMADGPEVTAPTFPAPTNLAYKVSWDVTAGPTDPAELVAGIPATGGIPSARWISRGSRGRT